MSRADVGFRMVLFGDVADDQLLAEGRRNDEVVADRLAELIGTRFGVVVDDRLRTALLTAVAAGDALVKLAFECDPEQGDPAVLAEARRVVQGIFERGGPREYGGPAGLPGAREGETGSESAGSAPAERGAGGGPAVA